MNYITSLQKAPLSELAGTFGQEQVYGTQGATGLKKILPKGASFIPELQYDFASGGRAGFIGGGIAGIRRPHAIPPKSGPMPQGGGLSSMFNRVRKW